jgi:hypothetical protein
MSKEITLQILDPVGNIVEEMKMKSSTLNFTGRNRLVFLDDNQVIGFIKIIDDGNGNIVDIELDKNTKISYE